MEMKRRADGGNPISHVSALFRSRYQSFATGSNGSREEVQPFFRATDSAGVNEPAVGRVYVASAKLTDTSAMIQLLAAIPNGDELRSLLDEMGPGHLHAYHAQTRTARYVASDGDIVMCFTVINVRPEQAATIAAECESIATWDDREFYAAVVRSLGQCNSGKA
jgi:hypothetical protein